MRRLLALAIMGLLNSTHLMAIEGGQTITSGNLRASVAVKGTDYRTPITFSVGYQVLNSKIFLPRQVRSLPIGRIDFIKGIKVVGGGSALLIKRAVSQGRHAINYYEVYALAAGSTTLLAADVLHVKREFILDPADESAFADSAVRLINSNGKLFAVVVSPEYSCDQQRRPMCQYKDTGVVRTVISPVPTAPTQAKINSDLANGWDSIPEATSLIAFPHFRMENLEADSFGNRMSGNECYYSTATEVECLNQKDMFLEL